MFRNGRKKVLKKIVKILYIFGSSGYIVTQETTVFVTDKYQY